MTNIDPQPPSFWDDHGARIVGLIVFSLALAGQPADPVPGALLREGTFLSVGAGFARGLGAVLAHLPDPSPVGWMTTGYAAVLSVLIRAWPAMPDGFALVQLFNSLCMGAAAWGLCAWVRGFAFPNHFIDAAVGLVFIAPGVVGLSRFAVPEPMVAMLIVAAVISARASGGDWRRAALAGLLSGLAAVSHGLGWAAVAGALVGLKSGGRGTVTAFAIGAGLFVGPMVWGALTNAPTDLGLLALKTAALQQDPHSLATAAGVLWNSTSVISLVGVVVAFAFFVRGVAALWVMDRSVSVALAVILVIAAGWPGAPAAWTAMATPFFVFGAVIGARRVWGSDRRFRVPVMLLVVTGYVAMLPAAARGVLQHDEAAAARREVLHLTLSSLRNELPAEAVVATDAAVMVFLYSNHRTVPLAGDESVEHLCAQRVTHLAIMRTPELPEAFAAARADSLLLREFDLTDGPSLYRLACS